jgi:hypothetical protein
MSSLSCTYFTTDTVPNLLRIQDIITATLSGLHVKGTLAADAADAVVRQHTSAYVSIRQHTSAEATYVRC